MSLLPEERKILDRMDNDLCAAEPRLASQFLIFTRLTSDEGQPPDEDLVIVPPRRPLGPRGSGVDARDRLRRRIILILLLAALLAMILILSLTGYR